MKYVTTQQNMADDIHFCLHTAIKTVYPKYYPKEVADFFLPAPQQGAYSGGNRFGEYGRFI